MEKVEQMLTTETLYFALARAQMEMEPALKDSKNPHFNSKYADLKSVWAACVPALNRNGIAVLQMPWQDDSGTRFLRTQLVHGTTGQVAECSVPLIVSKNDMQGYGSAVTYARRYGLMCLAGIAPEDDDGNAAVAAAPKTATAAHMKRELEALRADLVDVHSDVALKRLWTEWRTRMNRDNWPECDPQDETAFRNVAISYFSEHRRALEAEAKAETASRELHPLEAG